MEGEAVDACVMRRERAWVGECAAADGHVAGPVVGPCASTSPAVTGAGRPLKRTLPVRVGLVLIAIITSVVPDARFPIHATEIA